MLDYLELENFVIDKWSQNTDILASNTKNRKPSTRKILTETISAIDLLVFPLSSFIVIGLSSRMRSRAAGQSN